MAASIQYDPTVVDEATINLGKFGKPKLKELNGPRKRKYREHFKALDAIDDNDESEESELASIGHIGGILEAVTDVEEGLADKLVQAWKDGDEDVTDGFLARSLKMALTWAKEQQGLGEG